MRRARTTRRGFTLLELTVAVAMLAVVALSLYAAMTVAFRARRSALAQINGVAAAGIALDVIAQDLQNAVPPSPLNAANEGGLSYFAGPMLGTEQAGPTGPAADLDFFALGRDANGLADPLSDGVRRVQLLLDTSETPPRLVRRVQRNVLSDGALDVQDEPLLGGVRAFGLRYYDGSAWQQTWDSTNAGNVLPLAIEITLELDTPSPTRPDLFYRLTQVVPLAAGKIADTATTN